MTLDEAIRQARGALAQPPDRAVPRVRVVEADALQALVEHAQAGQALRDVYAMPSATGPATLRDKFAMHAPMAPLPDGMGGNAAEREILRNRARVALAYANEMMRQTGRS